MEGDGKTERGTERGLRDKERANKQKARQSDGATLLSLLLR